MNIGKSIQRLRHEAGLTTRTMASLIGISQTSLSLIENGHHKIKPANLESVAKVFHTTAGMIMMCSIETHKMPPYHRQKFEQELPNFAETIFKMIVEGYRYEKSKHNQGD